jgi:hypothetical protein
VFSRKPAQTRGYAVAAHKRKIHVKHDQGWPSSPRVLQRLLAICGGFYGDTFIFEYPSDKLPHRWVVLHDEDGASGVASWRLPACLHLHRASSLFRRVVGVSALR